MKEDNGREKEVDKSCKKCGLTKWQTKEEKCSCGGEMIPFGEKKEVN